MLLSLLPNQFLGRNLKIVDFILIVQKRNYAVIHFIFQHTTIVVFILIVIMQLEVMFGIHSLIQFI